MKKIIALLLLAGGTINAGAQELNITRDWILEMKFVTDVAIDPDGKHVAYTVSVPRTDGEEPGGRYSELWAAGVSGEEHESLLLKPLSAWSPSWSADGKKIYFLSLMKDKSKYTQLWSVTLKDKTPLMETSHDGSIMSYKWSPDGKSLAYIAGPPDSEDEELRKKAGQDWVVDDGGAHAQRLWVRTMEGKTTMTADLVPNDWTVWDFTWSPDNMTIAFQASSSSSTDHSYMFKKLYTIRKTGGEPSLLCDTQGKLGPFAFSPDGLKIAFLGAVSKNDPLSQSVYIVPSKGGTPKNLTEGQPFSAEELLWRSNDNLLVIVTRSCHTNLLSLKTDGTYTVAAGDGIIMRNLRVSPDGRIAFTGSLPLHPWEAFSSTIEPYQPVKISTSNEGLDKIRLARQEIFTWNSPDGWPIEGILTYPVNYTQGTRYPLVLQIHGGPEGVSLNGWTTRSLYPVQLLAAQGYFVLEPNYRGSGGKGVSFSKADHNDLGGKEFDDVLSGIDELIKQGKISGGKVGIGGWSYGGYLSAWAATRHSQRFKAAVMSAGISNWVSFMGTTDIPYEMSLVHWDSWWFDKPELHWARSPLSGLNSASTPTLIVHGMNDERVPPGQSMELYNGFRLKGIPSSLVLYPREGHGIRERAHESDYMDRVLQWYRKYLVEEGNQ